MRVYKSKRVPRLHFSALCDIFRKKIFVEKFQVFFQKNVLRFLSLKYSADLRRSRLVGLKTAFYQQLKTASEQNYCVPQK